MKLNIFFLLFITCIYISTKTVYGQNDYFATDSSVFAGVSIVNGGYENGQRIIRVSTADRIFDFSADDIKEYGLADGTVYVSKEIEVFGNNQKVFLEFLFNGKYKLYQYSEGKSSRFFIEMENSFFTELIKDNDQYKTQLSTIFNSSPHVSDNIKLLRFKKRYLIKLLDNLNKNLIRPIPHTKIGLSTILSLTSLNVPDYFTNKYLSGLSFKRNKSLGVGFFIDTPIEMSNLTLNVGLNYQKSSFSINTQKDSAETDIVVNISYLNIPIMFRYTIPKNGWMPFFNLGGNFKHIIQNSNEIYITERDANTITIEKVEDLKLFNKNMMAFTIGVGFQYQLNYKNYFSSEIRYSRFYSSKNFLGIDQIQLLVSFSF